MCALAGAPVPLTQGRIMRGSSRTFVFFCLLFLMGCGGADEGVPAGAAQAGEAEGPLFGAEFRDRACEILTGDLVSEVMGVAADDLDVLSMAGGCYYSWEGGSAELPSVAVRDDAVAARGYFENAYGGITPEQAEAAREAIATQLERQVAEGQITREQADAAGGLGSLMGSMASQAGPEPVEGIGDAAMYDGTVRELPEGRVTAESQAAVLLGNLVFTVKANLWPPGCGGLDARLYAGDRGEEPGGDPRAGSSGGRPPPSHVGVVEGLGLCAPQGDGRFFGHEQIRQQPAFVRGRDVPPRDAPLGAGVRPTSTS